MNHADLHNNFMIKMNFKALTARTNCFFKRLLWVLMVVFSNLHRSTHTKHTRAFTKGVIESVLVRLLLGWLSCSVSYLLTGSHLSGAAARTLYKCVSLLRQMNV